MDPLSDICLWCDGSHADDASRLSADPWHCYIICIMIDRDRTRQREKVDALSFFALVDVVCGIKMITLHVAMKHLARDCLCL